MDRLLPSLRYTLRLLLKSPGFTITAVLILGFGIGVNTATFSLIDGVLLKKEPRTVRLSLCRIFNIPLLACVVPVLRAIRINPITALRE